MERGYEPRVLFDWKLTEAFDWLSRITPKLSEEVPQGTEEARTYTSELQQI
jgi:hypothetical protein